MTQRGHIIIMSSQYLIENHRNKIVMWCTVNDATRIDQQMGTHLASSRTIESQFCNQGQMQTRSKTSKTKLETSKIPSVRLHGIARKKTKMILKVRKEPDLHWNHLAVRRRNDTCNKLKKIFGKSPSHIFSRGYQMLRLMEQR